MTQAHSTFLIRHGLPVICSLALRFELHQCSLFLTFAGFNLLLPSLAGAIGEDENFCTISLGKAPQDARPKTGLPLNQRDL